MGRHERTNHGRSEGEENFGEFPVIVGGQGPSDASFSRTHTHVGVRRWDLTESDRGGWGGMNRTPWRAGGTVAGGGLDDQ